MEKLIQLHKELISWARNIFGWTHYTIYWISFLKGIIFALLLFWIF